MATNYNISLSEFNKPIDHSRPDEAQTAASELLKKLSLETTTLAKNTLTVFQTGNNYHFCLIDRANGSTRTFQYNDDPSQPPNKEICKLARTILDLDTQETNNLPSNQNSSNTSQSRSPAEPPPPGVRISTTS